MYKTSKAITMEINALCKLIDGNSQMCNVLKEISPLLSMIYYIMTCNAVTATLNQHCSIIAVPPSLTKTPADQTVIESDTATFHCNATGNPTPKITWIKDGKTVELGDTLSIDSNRNHSGKYWCLADNGLNSTANASAILDVQCK